MISITYFHRVQAELERTQARIAELERLVYVPGAWRCAKCKFVLIQSHLNARDGSITARDDPGDKCPNCDSPLWRVTWRQDAEDMAKRLEEFLEREAASKLSLADPSEARVDNAARVMFALNLDELEWDRVHESVCEGYRHSARTALIAGNAFMTEKSDVERL